MMQNLIALLQKAGLDVNDEDIADVLWLATKLDAELSPQRTGQSGPPSAHKAPQQSEQDNPPPKLRSPAPSSDRVPQEPTVPLYPENPTSQAKSPAPSAQPSGLPFQTPAAPALRHTLELGRSLRPLMRKVPSRIEMVLDEEATATQIAERQSFIPVFCPAPERWLDLALVIEESPSTRIWDATIAEFQRLIERQGAFRDVRTWSLSMLPGSTPQISPRQKVSIANQQPRSPKELSDPSGRRLIWLLSDCTSPIWQQQALYDMLIRWAVDGPVALIQLLPDRLWERTALGYSAPVQFSALLPGVPNPHLQAMGLPEWETVNPVSALKLPVITLEPESMEQWAQVLVGMGNVQTAGFVVEAAKVIARSQEFAAEQPRQLSAVALVQRFRTTASSLAQRLAGMMAAVPVSLPVIHLIQQTLLPESNQVHIAEVLMSGLLQRTEVSATASPLSSVQYEFVDETIRDLLIDREKVQTTDAVLEAVSQYIARKAGLSIYSFTALLAPNLNVQGTEHSELLPFARIAKRVLQRLGGEYAALVEEIEQQQIDGRQQERQPIDEATAIAALEEHLNDLQQEILHAFVRQDHQFSLNPHQREMEIELITVAAVQDVLVEINKSPLTDISENYVFWELSVKIKFSVEITHAYFGDIESVLSPVISSKQVYSNQEADAVAEVSFLFSPDVYGAEVQLLELRVDQPISISLASLEEDSSGSFPPLQEFEFEVATIAFDDDSPLADSDEIHAAAIAWFTNQNIEVRSYSRLEHAIAEQFDRFALEMGDHYDVLAPLLQQVQHASSRRNHNFRYQLVEAPETTISGCVGLCHDLNNAVLFTQFRYDRATHTLSGTLVNEPYVLQFFSGAWFTRYVYQKIVRLLQEQGLQYSYLMQPVVGLPNGDRLELDLFFLVENQPLLIECKTGKELRDAIDQVSRFGTQLAIPPSQVLFIALDRTSKQLERYTSPPVEQFAPPSLNLVLASRDTFLTEIRSVLETLIASSNSNVVPLEPFEFEMATLEIQRSQHTTDLSTSLNAFQLVDQAVFEHSHQRLEDLLGRIFLLAWEGMTYDEMAVDLGYSRGYLSKKAVELWRLLSEVIGEEVTKPGLRQVIESWARGGTRKIILTRLQRQALQFVEHLSNGFTLEMVEIPGGRFQMGSPEDELDRYSDESPPHLVTLLPFFIGKYPVTQAQWQAVAALPQVNQALDPDPSNFKGVDRPVENVSWLDAVEFCDRLSRHTRRPYRLPSEAEWEYACRAGTTTPFHFGETITTDLANYDGTDAEDGNWSGSYGPGPKGIYRQETTPVGSFSANAFGLYDMHGNVWEWCLDHWHGNYDGAPVDGSAWTDQNVKNDAQRVLRGGSWSSLPRFCRSATRNSLNPATRADSFGFRVVCSAPRTL